MLAHCWMRAHLPTRWKTPMPRPTTPSCPAAIHCRLLPRGLCRALSYRGRASPAGYFLAYLTCIRAARHCPLLHYRTEIPEGRCHRRGGCEPVAGGRDADTAVRRWQSRGPDEPRHTAAPHYRAVPWPEAAATRRSGTLITL